MANGERVIQPFAAHEDVRELQFKEVWTQELDDVFADVAGYYDRANHVASLGLWNWFRSSFLSTIELKSGQRVLDVCAGTNAVGIAMLRKQPDIEVHAMDRSEAMQEVGQQRAAQLGLHIDSVIGDVHKLPFPDNHFDVVTLQYASRHLRIMDVVLQSTTKFIANRKTWQDDWKRRKIEQIAMLLQGALAAESRVLLKMNAPAGKVAAISKILPSLHAPTINPLASSDWVAVESVVEEKVVREIIPALKREGAEGIIELPLNKVIR